MSLIQEEQLQVMTRTNQEKLVNSFSGKGSMHFPLTVVPGVGSYQLELCRNGSGRLQHSDCILGLVVFSLHAGKLLISLQRKLGQNESLKGEKDS